MQHHSLYQDESSRRSPDDRRGLLSSRTKAAIRQIGKNPNRISNKGLDLLQPPTLANLQQQGSELNPQPSISPGISHSFPPLYAAPVLGPSSGASTVPQLCGRLPSILSGRLTPERISAEKERIASAESDPPASFATKPANEQSYPVPPPVVVPMSPGPSPLSPRSVSPRLSL